MSKMSDLMIQIEECLRDGMTPEAVAAFLDVPLDWVYTTEESMAEEYDGQPDEAQEWYDYDPDC